MKSLVTKIASVMASILLLAGCSSGPMSADELAAREIDSDASLWDEEDYKSIAAKSCLKYKVVFNKAVGEWYAEWAILGMEYVKVGLTSGALEDHPKWGPIDESVSQMTSNAINRTAGGSGTTVSSDLAVEVFNLCKEIGVDLTE
jgi:hypothetical protein